jgi:signal-transduction protein with cAMP-binding, CBS, and nucleotidyltransferase domain
MTVQAVSTLMQHPLVELDPDATVAFALQVAGLVRTHHFPLFRAGALVGIVCTCDLDDAPRDRPISELSRTEVLTISVDSSLDEAARLMRDHVAGSVVVLDDNAPCGLLTREALTGASERWAAYFADEHCEACGAEKHLRRSSSGQLLCTACAARAHDAPWLDVGGGD